MIQPINVNIIQGYVSQGSGGGSGLSGVLNVVSSGTTTFNLASGYFVAGSTVLFVNGVYQYWGTDYTENSNRQGITTTAIIPSTWVLELRYVPSST